MNQAHETEHMMRLNKIYPTGAEEWCCIYCERRVMKQHNPLEQEIVLDPGLTLGENVKETEISEELWLAVKEVLSGVDMNW
jgi:hypothetical protein